jgi:hypothetical protein
MYPARIISLWLGSSASEGASFWVEMKNCETRMMFSNVEDGPAILQGMQDACIQCLEFIGKIPQAIRNSPHIRLFNRVEM